ncbi:MAG TPA: carboxypeptidase M32, partial [Alphaproteobacteria bacterium]|nr:carboxypeptidase M32 [Alphaproteobacteria bacterium]
MSAYQELTRRFSRITSLDNALGILQWDQETTMPEGAADVRAEAMATLSVLRHEMLVDARLGDWLDEAGGRDDLDEWQRANLREMRRLWVHATALPADLVEANSKAVSKCEMAWRSARKNSDFASLLPSLREVLRCQRAIAEAKADKLGVSPYDALLDSYEPGGRSARIDEVFDDLAVFLPGFIDEALAHQARRPAVEPLSGPFPVEIQREIGVQFMKAAGFDFDRGRLDVSLHPFCGGADDDVRITTRYDDQDFTSALMGVLHETGHALYEQGRPREWRSQPVGAARGMSLHESQSLIVEMQASRSRAFLEWAAPVIRDAFRGQGNAWEAVNLHRLYTRVERGLIRVDADEATYPAHVILRYRLEKALIAGEMDLADLPAAWN